MSSPHPSAAQTAPETEDHQFYQHALRDLVAMGMDIARSLHAQATDAQATDTPEPKPDLTIPFERITRTVRRTIRLAQHLAQQKPAPHLHAQTQARKQILRTVENIISRTHTGPKAQALHTELLDRLDRPDLIEDLGHDIATRPIPKIIGEIAEDLGLANVPGMITYPRRTPDDIRQLIHRATPNPIPRRCECETPPSAVDVQETGIDPPPATPASGPAT